MQFEFDLARIPENDGLSVSIIGMAIVFIGLVLVSLLIFGLPKALDWLDAIRRSDRHATGDRRAIDNTDEDRCEEAIVAAIAMVLDDAMRPEDGSAVQRITIRRSGSDSIWRQAGQMRSLSSHTPIRKGSP